MHSGVTILKGGNMPKFKHVDRETMRALRDVSTETIKTMQMVADAINDMYGPAGFILITKNMDMSGYCSHIANLDRSSVIDACKELIRQV